MKYLHLFWAFVMVALMVYGYMIQNGIGTGLALFNFIFNILVYVAYEKEKIKEAK